ncbi:MAG: diguanylate cyclase [Peptostreptococcaceae bacterium]|nr:diguanylate cyclase [Peptostreptococcaceae bacterium]
MTHEVPYILIPTLALLCYAVLVLAMLSAKKNRIIYAFILYLTVFILWTGGSVLMRLQLYPGYEFWYQVSILSVFALAFFLYHFLYCYLDYKNHIIHLLWGVLTLLLLVFTYFECFLPIPELEFVDGNNVFVYTSDWKLIFPTILVVAIIVSIVKMLYYGYKKNDYAVLTLKPFLIGSLLLVVGNILSVLPGNIFPWDTLSGIINAGLAFYVLAKRRIFKLTLLISKSVLVFISLIITSILNVSLIDFTSNLIDGFFPFLTEDKVAVQCIIFGLCLILIYKVCLTGTNLLFMKKEQLNKDILKTFSSEVSKSLESKTILKLTEKVLLEGLPVNRVYFLIYDALKDQYTTTHSSNPLTEKTLAFAADAPLIQSLKAHDQCMFIKDIKKTTIYRAMWETEKRIIHQYSLAAIVPLSDDNNALFGFIALGEQDSKSNFDYDAVNFMESIRAISTIGLRNATKYEKAEIEAVTDSLTGLYNRRYFINSLENIMHSNTYESVALLLISIDDFRLYNELYGSLEGDIALENLSLRIKNTIGDSGIAGRFSGKEFAIYLPNKSHIQALQLAQSLQTQMTELNNKNVNVKLKNLTFSAGICVYPYSAVTFNELVTNTNMAVYQAKHSGKNRIITYQKESKTSTYLGNSTTANKRSGAYEEYASTIYALTAAIDAKDHYTFNHSQTVATYASVLAKHIGLNSAHVDLIYEAGLLHDIGKIAIPENILSKPGKLNDEEYVVMQSHVVNSIEIIRHLPNLDYLIPAVTGHHERWDGKGYPRGISGKEIPIGARCLALSDSFDAMLSERAYKEPYSLEFACNEIVKKAGLQFDPELAFTFVDLIKKGVIYVNMPRTIE